MSNPQVQSDNWSTLAKIVATLSLPYICIGLSLFFSLMYSINFFGVGLAGCLVAGLFLLILFTLTSAIANNIIRPVLLNLLAQGIISMPGCLIGLLGFFVTALSVVFFLSRDPLIAGLLFLAAPVVGGGVAFLISAGGRMRSLPRLSGRSTTPSIRVEKPKTLPGGTKRASLPPRSSPSQSTRSPTSRRNTKPTKRQPPRSSRPPRRR